MSRTSAPPDSAIRARSAMASLSTATALAALVRDHGLPARVVVGRKRGGIRLRVAAVRWHAWQRPVWLPVARDAVLEWLGY